MTDSMHISNYNCCGGLLDVLGMLMVRPCPAMARLWPDLPVSVGALPPQMTMVDVSLILDH